MKKYEVVFMDLDHTIWDFERNANETLVELFKEYRVGEEKGVDDKEFIRVFHRENDRLWEKYDRKEIGRKEIREQRFKNILTEVNPGLLHLSDEIAHNFLSRCPEKTQLFPHAVEVLESLYQKYKLVVITNGFDEIQYKKLANSKIDHFFDEVVTSERAGYRKPEKEIFHFALQLSKVREDEAIMVGDNLIADIRGANAVNIDSVFFNPGKVQHKEKVAYEIHGLKELLDIL